jgi:MoaA/NifB/PqqE/SkfB family radical SAM enzyme
MKKVNNGNIPSYKASRGKIPIITGEQVYKIARKLWRYKTVYPQAAINFIKKEPFSASFDLTHNCNCRCDYCYYYLRPYEQRKESLNDEDLLAFIKKVRRNIPIIHATFIGGEPTLRAPVLREAVEYFPHSWVITNGTRGFNLARPDCWIWSLDGLPETHNRIKAIRKSAPYKDYWNKSVNQLLTASAPVVTNTNLNQLTIKDLVPYIHKMAKTDIRGMILSFYTPFDGENANLALSDKQRTKAIGIIDNLRKEYENFILTTAYMNHYFSFRKGGLESWNSPETCPVAIYSRAYSSSGKMYQQCAMGKGAHCARCGCGMSPLFKALLRLDYQTIKWLITVV